MTDASSAQPLPQRLPERPPAAAEDPSWLQIVWGQFKKRKIPYYSMWGVFGLFLIAVYAPVFISNKPFVWNGGDGLEFPWLTTLFNRNTYENAIDIFFNSLLLPGTLLIVPVAVVWRRTAGRPRRARIAARQRAMLGAFGAWAVALVALLAFPLQAPTPVYPEVEATLEAAGTPVTAVYAPVPYSYRGTDISKAMEGPSTEHLLGTDGAGSDVFARMVFGTRVSLTVGIFAVLLYITVGTVVGAVAGFFGGRLDTLLMRIVEVVICIPSLFLVLSVAAFIPERSIFHIMLIIAAVAWTGPARLVRAEFLRLRELDFVAAARASGFGKASIIFEEILPNALGPVLVSATFGVASAILVESTMSFLGLGDISVPSWGQILATGRQTSSWTLILAPGFAIFLTVSLLNLLGEGVRDALDPKLRS
ncbi:MAG: ABC transporter permease [Pseudomonadota bacterium]|nr:ABC transporter permease [Pseudomonadota bacterium]